MRPAGSEALPRPLGDVPFGQNGGELAGRRGASRPNRAVGDHHRGFQAKQRSAAVRLGVEPLAELAQGAA